MSLTEAEHPGNLGPIQWSPDSHRASVQRPKDWSQEHRPRKKSKPGRESRTQRPSKGVKRAKRTQVRQRGLKGGARRPKENVNLKVRGTAWRSLWRKRAGARKGHESKSQLRFFMFTFFFNHKAPLFFTDITEDFVRSKKYIELRKALQICYL